MQSRAGMSRISSAANWHTHKPKHSFIARRQVTPQCSANTFSLNCGATTVKLPMQSDQVKTLAVAINDLLKTFAEKQKAEKPQRWATLECKIVGERSFVLKKNVICFQLSIGRLFQKVIQSTPLTGLINSHFFLVNVHDTAGDPSKGEIPSIELFCNPNAHATAFDARVLVSLTSADGLHVVTEATLEQVRAGVKDVLLQSKQQQ